MNLKLEAEERAIISPSPPLGDLSSLGSCERNLPEAKARCGPRERARASHWAGVRWFFSQARLLQFSKFCLVGGSGVFVDMGILYLLADPSRLGLNITLSKIAAAEIAMMNNFIWNELWTFRQSPSSPAVPLAHRMGEGPGVRAMESGERAGVRSRLSIRHSKFAIRNSVFLRFLLFNAICGIGIGLAVLLLHLFHTWFGWNLYLSNLLAIILVTLWNYGMNAWWNWRRAL